jgi:prefoldin beta subunit
MSEDIQQLSMLEQHLTNIISQKQQYNKQLLDIESAISELDSVEEAYQIVGSVMIKKKSVDMKTNLDEKKELIKIRLQSLDKQEQIYQEQAKELQDKVMTNLDNQ